jgi:hypothetical protein
MRVGYAFCACQTDAGSLGCSLSRTNGDPPDVSIYTLVLIDTFV